MGGLLPSSPKALASRATSGHLKRCRLKADPRSVAVFNFEL
jgi:hypothetical protein